MSLICKRIGSKRLGCLSHQFSTWCSLARGARASIHHAGGVPIVERPVARTPVVAHQFASVRFFAAPVSARKAQEKEVKVTRTNEEITALYVRLVSDEGHTVVSRREALHRARTLDLDLVEVDCKAEPPVCKIMDFHKEKFKKEVRDKELAKAKSESNVRKGDCKEVHFTGKIEQKDLEMKADTVKRLMERGYRVKVVAEAGKKSDTSDAERQDLGAVLQRLYTLIEDISAVESAPRVEKRMAYLIVRHAKFGTKKNPAKKTSTTDEAKTSDIQVDATATATSRNIKQAAEFIQATVAGVKNLDIPSHFKESHNVEAHHPMLNSISRLDTSETNQRYTGYSPVVDMIKAKCDDRGNQKDRHVPIDSSSAKLEPSPALSNRYQRSKASSRPDGARIPPRPSFDRSRNNVPLDLEQHQSLPSNSNARGRVPYQIPSDKNRKHGHVDLKNQPPLPQDPSTTRSSFGIFSASNATPSVDRNSADCNRDKGKGPLNNSLNLPELKTETPKKENRSQREWGVFSR